MAGKDITEKILEDFPDVFADIVNVLLFDGKQEVLPSDLENMQMRSAYRAEGDIHEIERDVAKRWRRNNFKIVADYFVQKRKNNDYEPTKEKIQHVHALLQLLSVMENDVRFEEILNDEEEGGIQNMCDVLDKVEKNGEKKGIEKAVLDNIKSLMESMKWTAQQAMDALKIPSVDQSKYASKL